MTDVEPQKLEGDPASSEGDPASSHRDQGAERPEAERAPSADEGVEADRDDEEEQDESLETLPGGAATGPGLERSVAVRATHLKSVLESLIFVADKPISERQLARAAKSKLAEIRPLLQELVEEYAPRGVNLVEVSNGYQFRSAVVNAPFVRSFVARKPVRLTRAQLETLSIVSYRQPVTRPEIDEIRGVDSGSALKVLSERSLLKVLGRKDEPGRPLLYGTSEHFLEFFGLKSLRDLPTLQEFTELSDESRGIFERRMGETVDFSKVEEAAQRAEAAAQDELLDEEDTTEDGTPEEGAAGEDERTSVGEAVDTEERAGTDEGGEKAEGRQSADDDASLEGYEATVDDSDGHDGDGDETADDDEEDETADDDEEDETADDDEESVTVDDDVDEEDEDR